MNPQPDTWPRLAGAVHSARTVLRAIIGRIDAGADRAEIRQMAADGANQLTGALKDRQPRQNRDSARFQPLWRASR